MFSSKNLCLFSLFLTPFLYAEPSAPSVQCQQWDFTDILEDKQYTPNVCTDTYIETQTAPLIQEMLQDQGFLASEQMDYILCAEDLVPDLIKLSVSEDYLVKVHLNDPTYFHTGARMQLWSLQVNKNAESIDLSFLNIHYTNAPILGLPPAVKEMALRITKFLLADGNYKMDFHLYSDKQDAEVSAQSFRSKWHQDQFKAYEREDDQDWSYLFFMELARSGFGEDTMKLGAVSPDLFTKNAYGIAKYIPTQHDNDVVLMKELRPKSGAGYFINQNFKTAQFSDKVERVYVHQTPNIEKQNSSAYRYKIIVRISEI